MSQDGLLDEVLGLWETARRYEPALTKDIGAMPSADAFGTGVDALRKGREVALRSLRILRKLGQPESVVAAGHRLILGCGLLGDGKYRRAVRHLERALSLHREHLGLEHPTYRVTLFQWARAAWALGQTERVIAALEECVAADAEGGSREDLDGLEDLLGSLYGLRRDPARARRILERVLERRIAAHGRESREAVETSLALAATLERDEDGLHRLRSLIDEACSVVDANRGVFWADKAAAQAYSAAADLAVLDGDEEREAACLRHVVETNASVATALDPTTVAPAMRLAANRLAAGDASEAGAILADLESRAPSLEWMAPADRKAFLALYLRAAHELGADVSAATIQRQWIDAAADGFRAELAYLEGGARAAAARALWNDIRSYLAFILDQGEALGPGDVEHAYELVMEFKGIVAASLCVSRERRLEGLFPEHRAALERLTELRRLLRNTYADVFQGLPESGSERAASALKRELTAIEARLSAAIPGALDEPRLTVEDAARLCAECAPGSLLLDFARAAYSDGSGQGMAVFVLPAGRPDLLGVIALDDWEGVRGALIDWRREACAGSEPDSGELMKLFWQPLADIVSQVEELQGAPFPRILYSPDDVLHWLPVQALRDTASGGHLIDRYEVSWLGAARDLANAAAPADQRRPGAAPLAVGLDEFGPGGPGKLGFAEEEARAVVKLIGGEALTGPERVTKDALVRRLGHIDHARGDERYQSPAIVHFATHGVVAGDTPESARCGLLLSGGAESLAAWLRGAGDSPSILDSGVISGLDLRDTRLATLSGCDSGLGPVAAGEGVFGLHRAFQIAGARALVMSLWPVDDLAAKMFMRVFYARLQSGAPIPAALRDAQLRVRTRFPSAYYWGGFVCFGGV